MTEPWLSWNSLWTRTDLELPEIHQPLPAPPSSFPFTVESAAFIVVGYFDEWRCDSVFAGSQ